MSIYFAIELSLGEISYVCARAHVRALMTRKSCAVGMRNAILRNYFKAVKYEIQNKNNNNLSRNIVSLQVLVGVSRFSPCVINLSRNKNSCCGFKKIVAKSKARVYFEQQILALLLVFHQTHNLSSNKFTLALANQPISALHPQLMFLLRVKLITQGEKRETSTKTCNETMLRNTLRVFVSRISPSLWNRSYHAAVHARTRM